MCFLWKGKMLLAPPPYTSTEYRAPSHCCLCLCLALFHVFILTLSIQEQDVQAAEKCLEIANVLIKYGAGVHINGALLETCDSTRGNTVPLIEYWLENGGDIETRDEVTSSMVLCAPSKFWNELCFKLWGYLTLYVVLMFSEVGQHPITMCYYLRQYWFGEVFARKGGQHSSGRQGSYHILGMFSDFYVIFVFLVRCICSRESLSSIWGNSRNWIRLTKGIQLKVYVCIQLV